MDKRKLTITLAIICAVGLIASVIIYLNKDRTEPVIEYTGEVTYKEGEDTSKLLEGVTAIDNKDGDVSDTLMIESIYTSDNTAKIVYCAYDSSYNVAKLQRIVPFEKAEEEVVVEEPEVIDYPELIRNSKVTILNGTRSSGVSTYWQAQLQNEGFTDTYIGTSSIKVNNTIIYTNDDNYHEYLSELFPLASFEYGTPNGSDLDLSDSSVVILIGEDYNTIGYNNNTYNNNDNQNTEEYQENQEENNDQQW